MQRLAAQIAVSVSDLKKSPRSVLDGSGGQPVAVLNHNRVMAYMVPAATYEALLDRLDDQALVEVIRARADEKPVRISLDEL